MSMGSTGEKLTRVLGNAEAVFVLVRVLNQRGVERKTLSTDLANSLNSNPGIRAPGLQTTQCTILDRGWDSVCCRCNLTWPWLAREAKEARSASSHLAMGKADFRLS